MRAGQTYVNIHSNIWPGGEVRSQIIPPSNPNGFGFHTGESEHSGHSGAAGH
jgi:hypothetical protein